MKVGEKPNLKRPSWTIVIELTFANPILSEGLFRQSYSFKKRMVKLANIFLIEITFLAKIITRQFMGLQPKKIYVKKSSMAKTDSRRSLRA